MAIPPAPRVPSERARELIFRYQGTQKAVLIIGLVFSTVGLALGVPFCWGLPSDLAISAGGTARYGSVVSARVAQNVKINDRHPTVVRFSYTVDDRRYEAESSTIDGVLAAQAREGESIPIEVSGINPQWARMAGTTRSVLGWGGAVVLLFPIIGLLMTGLAVRSNRREIRAFVYGQPAAAQVRGAGFDLSTTINGRHPWRVDWVFRLEDGKAYAGSLSSMSKDALEELSKAQEIAVLYDPADPSVNTAWVD
jgi:hypothetical protein